MRLRRAALASADGTRLATATATWGTLRPPGVVVLHATGLCKEVWEPFTGALAEMSSAAAVTTFDQRGHGDSGPMPVPFDWWLLGSDVLDVAAALVPARPVAVGHSSGATAMAMAEILKPGTFSALVLIEPILPPPPFRRPEAHPLIDMALRRHDTFADGDAARAEWAERPAFARWVPAALDAYARHGLAPAAGGMVLKCTRETEAESYAAGFAHGAVARVAEITCPVRLVAGAESDAPGPGLMKALGAAFPKADLIVLEGGTHFVPMEQPARIAEIVAGVLA